MDQALKSLENILTTLDSQWYSATLLSGTTDHHSTYTILEQIELIDCTFVGNQGTAITLKDSIIKVSGTITFVNNTAYEGGAMAFYGKSYITVSPERTIQILFINNYAEHVGGAIFAEETKDEDKCFFQLGNYYRKCSDLNNNHHLIFVFTNNTAHN